jgi:hypothetical protein
VLWLYSGFFSLGAVAGDIDQPKRTFSVVIATLLPLVMLLNVIPLAIALSVDQNLDNFEAGFFNKVASELAGPWLGYCFVAAANVCLVGLYSAQVCELHVGETEVVCVFVRVLCANAQRPRMHSISLSLSLRSPTALGAGGRGEHVVVCRHGDAGPCLTRGLAGKEWPRVAVAAGRFAGQRTNLGHL